VQTPDPSLLDRLADRGWPALEREALGGWTLRAAEGVTNRANSVLAAGRVEDLGRSVEDAERWYASRGLPAVFQVSPASPAALPGELRRRGYRAHSATEILLASRADIAHRAGPADEVTVATEPAPGWLDTWWAVDGRGGDRERGVVERILAAGPALYAWSGDPAAPDAVGRLALVGEWGGLYAVATLPRARRRGLGRAVVGALTTASEEHGVQRLWLQVLADNAPARALYTALGFAAASGYVYWSREP
jgi:N-acetylglutamate synthase